MFGEGFDGFEVLGALFGTEDASDDFLAGVVIDVGGVLDAVEEVVGAVLSCVLSDVTKDSFCFPKFTMCM